MSQRYVLVVGDDGPARGQLLAHLARAAGLRLAFANGRMAALVSNSCPCIPLGEAGCILGSLFDHQGPPERIQHLTAPEQTFIASSAGQRLMNRFWGGYVAAIENDREFRVIRDPSGILSCYYANSAGRLLFASDAELLVVAGVRPEIDHEEIGRQLYRAFVPVPSTALREVRELLAGYTLQLPSLNERQESCWSPWDHVAICNESRDEMVDRLGCVVRRCTQAWASNHANILLSVSGGLDSSILAACVACAGINATCLTMFAEDPTGDERVFARALCDHLGLPLIEWPYRLEDIDITEPLAAHLPRPRDRTQANAYERVHIEVAKEIGADAFMTGNGGDHVFGYSQSAAPIIDRYLFEGLRRGIVATLLDICRQTGCNIPDALRQACSIARRSPDARIAPRPLFLDRQFTAACDQPELCHQWLNVPVGALPGKTAHIATILRLQSHLEYARGYHLPVISALASQPIVEACLAIPSWEWRAGGRDRAAARRAFSCDLPAIIASRTVKGSPSGFGAKLFDHFRAPIRDRLLGGRLAAHRIVDKPKLEHFLGGERPVPHAERVRMLELVNAEAWIDHWMNARHRA